MSAPNLLIADIYFVFIGFLGFFSIFGVYILIRYGASRTLATAVGGIFSALFLKILFESYQTLSSIIF